MLIKSSSNKDAQSNASPMQRNKSIQNYKLGLFTILSNPKTAAFVASLFAAAMPAHPTYVVSFTSIFLMLLITICWYAIVAFLFSMDQMKKMYKKASIWIERMAGIFFIGFGFKLAMSD